MRVCHCTLPTFYPNACDNCSNNEDNWWRGGYIMPNKIMTDYPIQPKKITEKFDDKGNLIERITEE